MHELFKCHQHGSFLYWPLCISPCEQSQTRLINYKVERRISPSRTFVINNIITNCNLIESIASRLKSTTVVRMHTDVFNRWRNLTKFYDNRFQPNLPRKAMSCNFDQHNDWIKLMLHMRAFIFQIFKLKHNLNPRREQNWLVQHQTIETITCTCTLAQNKPWGFVVWSTTQYFIVWVLCTTVIGLIESYSVWFAIKSRYQDICEQIQPRK